MKKKVEPRLEIYKDRSLLIDELGEREVFREGSPSPDAIKRLEKIKSELRKGFLKNLIEECKTKYESLELTIEQEAVLERLVSKITSQYGRSVVGLTVLQLSIKAIEPSQSVRLHKAGRGDFSWEDGVPMRSLDSEFIAPVLRATNLLKYNIFGVMMTRSLAENYPYTHFYKAAIRGPKQAWLELVEMLEKGELKALEALKKLISLLVNRSDEFSLLSESLIKLTNEFLDRRPSWKDIIDVIENHINESSYPARLFEIAMHTMFQVLNKQNVLSGYLRPLSQMRSANKKHGNIADIEVTASADGSGIMEAWDAKYGKRYLLDELGELEDKLPNHKSLQRVGFVVDTSPDIRTEVDEKRTNLAEIFGVEVELLSFNEWLKEQFERAKSDQAQTAREWLTAYIESICLRRLNIAPIEEPAETWVREMKKTMKKAMLH